MNAILPAATGRESTETRQREIVIAALDIAAHTSPATITTTHIAKAVGLSQGALFKHFASKQTIWLAVVDWVASGLLSRLQAVADRDDAALVRLRTIYTTHVGFVADHPGVPRILFHELQQPDDSPIKQAVRHLLGRYHVMLCGVLNEARASGELAASVDVEAAATLFIGTIQGLIVQALASGDIAAMPAAAERVFVLYERAVCAGEVT